MVKLKRVINGWELYHNGYSKTAWQKGKKHVIFLKTQEPGNHYIVSTTIYASDDKKFSSRNQAFKYAIKYMRKH